MNSTKKPWVFPPLYHMESPWNQLIELPRLGGWIDRGHLRSLDILAVHIRGLLVLPWIGNFSWKRPISTGCCRFSQQKNLDDIVLASFCCIWNHENLPRMIGDCMYVIILWWRKLIGATKIRRYQQEKQEWNWYESGLMWATLDLKNKHIHLGPEKKKLCKNESVDKFWDSWWVRTGQWPLSTEPATLMVKSAKKDPQKMLFQSFFFWITESQKEVPVTLCLVWGVYPLHWCDPTSSCRE